MKSKEEIKKTIKDLKKSLDRYESQILKYRKHIEHLIVANGKASPKADVHKLPTPEAEANTVESSPEIHLTVASFIAQLSADTQLSKVKVKKIVKRPLKAAKPEGLYYMKNSKNRGQGKGAVADIA